MRILTFNHHESYISSLAKTDFDFDVVTKYGDLDLSWSKSSVAVPENCSLVAFDQSLDEKIRSGHYDWVICHTIKNLIWMRRYKNIKTVFVAHIPLLSHSILLRLKSAVKKMVFSCYRLLKDVTFVGVSRFKRDSWGEEGKVIILAPSVIPEQKKNSAHKKAGKVLVVCNQILSRKKELGWHHIEKVMASVPLRVIGSNPGLDEDIQYIPKNRDDFVNEFSSGSIYLYTIEQPIGDGYNTAMLEAMSIGMAVVTIANPSSPVMHGINGLVGKTSQDLINHIKFLQQHPEEIKRLGENAKKTIKYNFTDRAFVDEWKKVLA